MNKEEKKAIEIIKDEIDRYKAIETPKEVYITDIKMLLNLVEKQQNKIEELANGIRVLGTNPDITTEEIIKEFTEKPISEEYMKEFESRYISKEKIKNVLDEHFRFYKELRNQDNYPNEAIINSDCLSRLSMLQTLYLELLEQE